MGWLRFWDSTSGTSKKNLLFPHTIPMEFYKYHSLAVFQLGHLKNILKNLFALGLSCGMWDFQSSLQHVGFFFFFFSCSMWDLVPRPGIEPRSPALGIWSFSHWTTIWRWATFGGACGETDPALFWWSWEKESGKCEDGGREE